MNSNGVDRESTNGILNPNGGALPVPTGRSWKSFRALRTVDYSIVIVGTRDDGKEYCIHMVLPNHTLEQIESLCTDLTDAFMTLDAAGHIHNLTMHNPELEDSGRCEFKQAK